MRICVALQEPSLFTYMKYLAVESSDQTLAKLACLKGYFTYGSKILNTSPLPKRYRQTGQTQIRLLLKKQSNQGLPSLLF